jgi:thiamine-phosphate pyrophosphorylase
MTLVPPPKNSMPYGGVEETVPAPVVGPVFPTSTKETAVQALGPEAVARTAPLLRISFTVMGGIKTANVEELLRRGGRHIAVVTAVTGAPDVKAAAGRFREMIAAAGPPKSP